MSVPLRDVLRNVVKEKLARDEVVASMIVRLVRTVEIARIAASAGFDTLYIDVEHSSISLDAAGQICIAALGAGIAPFVRVPGLAPATIGRVLDGGALGIIAPHIRSAEDARKVVAAAKFPPYGERSANAGLPHLQYRNYPTDEANAALNDATLVAVMIETLEALDKVEEIAAVDGVDLLLVGTNDLTAEMGIPGRYDEPRVRAAFERIIAAARANGRHVGIGGLASRPDLTAEFVRMGARFVSTGTDLAFLMAGAAAKARQVAEIKL
ncbi:aldolase/citrate lyase family protein [Pigmentiphaga soli]|uniref:Aldolase/citrate lyase family protein n=1 Tax=Pigmentiphaga soli TaxID=1007095 RepID=A0ABP8GXD1_9BURK